MDESLPTGAGHLAAAITGTTREAGGLTRQLREATWEVER